MPHPCSVAGVERAGEPRAALGGVDAGGARPSTSRGGASRATAAHAPTTPNPGRRGTVASDSKLPSSTTTRGRGAAAGATTTGTGTHIVAGTICGAFSSAGAQRATTGGATTFGRTENSHDVTTALMLPVKAAQAHPVISRLPSDFPAASYSSATPTKPPRGDGLNVTEICRDASSTKGSRPFSPAATIPRNACSETHPFPSGRA